MQEQFTNLHSALSEIVRRRCSRLEQCSEWKEGVSRHKLDETIPFSMLENLYAVSRSHCPMGAYFIGSIRSDIIFSCKTTKTVPKNKIRKRVINDDEGIESTIRSIPDYFSKDEVNRVRSVLIRLRRDVCGSNKEQVVQSSGILVKKLDPNDSHPRVLIVVRFNAGVAVPLDRLKCALGECWSDGVITIGDSAPGIQQCDLPFNEEARISHNHGNSHIIMVTSVKHMENLHTSPHQSSTESDNASDAKRQRVNS